MDDLNILSGGLTGEKVEVSEKAIQKVQEDSKKAQQIRKQIYNQTQQNIQIANFIEEVLKVFGDNKDVIVYLYESIKDIEKKFNQIKLIFSPVLQKTYDKVSDYIFYLKQSGINLGDKEKEVIYSIIKTKKIGKKWDLIEKKGKLNEFLDGLKEEISKL